MSLHTVSCHYLLFFHPFLDLCVAGIFQPYESMSDVGSSTNASTDTLTNIRQPGRDALIVATRPIEVEANEEHVEFKHLNQNNPSPPTALPPPKRKGFRYFFLNKVPAIFGRKQKH